LSKCWYLTPGVTAYSATICNLLWRNTITHFPNIFLWLLYILKVYKLRGYLYITNIWGHFWSKFGYLTPRGDHFMVSPPAVWQFILEKYYHTLPQIHFCGYFISSKGPHLEVICILTIFGVIFGQNVGTWSPEVTLYSVTTCCFVIYFG
jgi:hypothetical protein